MESALLPWQWIIEHLASIPEAGTSVLSAIVDHFPLVLGDSFKEVRERLALRYLEERTGIACGETPPAVATKDAFASASPAYIDASRTCEEVLLSEVAMANNHDKGNAVLDVDELHRFILQKRAVLAKSSIELLKEKILGSYHPDLSCSKEFNGLPKEQGSWHANSSRGGDHGKKIVESADTNPCMPRLALIRNYRKLMNLSNPSLEGVRGTLQENSSSVQHLPDQNAPDDGKRYQQTNADDKCNEFLMGKNKVNLVEAPAEIHDVHIQSPKENLLDHAPAPINALDIFKESLSVKGSEKNNGLHHDIPELQEVASGSNDVQLLEQCSLPRPSSARCFCIKCGSSGQLLNCCGEGCSIAIHKSCLGLLATVEKTDPFYCPFCSYANAVKLIEKAKRKARDARRNILQFFEFCPAVCAVQRNTNFAKTMIASDSVSIEQNSKERPDFPSDQQLRSNSVESKHGDAQNQVTSNGKFTGDHSQEITQNEQNVAADIICENMLSCQKTIECYTYQEVEGTSIELKSKTGKEQENNRVSEDQQHVNDVGISGYERLSSELNTSHERNDDACVNDSGREVNRDHSQAGKRKSLHTCEEDNERQPIQPNKRSVFDVDGGCDHSAKRKALASKISDRFGKRNRREKATRTDNYHGVVENKKVDYPITRELRKSLHRQNQCQTVKQPSSRRPKLIWKPEEEEVLEEAMQKIPQNEDGSIPWIKILEYGRRVLHESRTPIDLKDKWRNMQKKEAKNRG